MRNAVKNIEVKYLISIANSSMIKFAEESLIKDYNLNKDIDIVEQLTQEHISHIQEMINNQEDPNHWSLIGYQNVINVWNFLQIK